MSLTRIGSIGINTGIAFAGVTTIVTLNTANDALSIGATVNVGSGITLGASGDIFATGVSTVSTLHVGSGVTLSSDGDVFATGISTFSEDIKVGSGVTISPDGDGFFTGVVTATSFIGDGSGLTNAGPSLTGSTNNTIVTVTGANAIQGESNLTFDGGTLSQTIDANDEGINITSSGAHAARLKVDTNQTSADDTIFFQSARWNGTEVASINMRVGDDTTNKDDGVITMHTTPSGGSIAERLRINSNGIIEMRSDMSSSGQENKNIFRFTDTDGGTAANQSMGRLQWFSSDTSGSGACVKAEIEALASDTTPDSYMVFKTHNTGTTPTERLRINSSGQVMIGTDTPTSNQAAQALTIALQNSGNTGMTLRSGTGGGDTNEGSIFFSDGTSGAAEYAGFLQYSHASNYFRIGVNSAERLRINSSGQLGLNTDTPDTTFTIKSGGDVQMSLKNASGTTKAYFGTDGAFGSAGTDDLRIRSDSSHIIFGFSGTEKVRMLSGGGITFNGDTAAANALDDYEEGTYTPTDASGAGLSFTINTTASYTKIGRMMYIQFDITWPSTSNSNTAGFTMPTGLGMSVSYGTGVIGWTDNGKPLFIHVGGQIYVMDNNNSVGNSSQHTLNSELSGKRIIGSVWYTSS